MNRCVALAPAVYLLCLSAANATVIDITPTIDGDAISPSWSPINNGSVLTASLGTPDPESRIVLEFDLSSLPLAVIIENATLNLYGASADANIGVHGYTGNGTFEVDDFEVNNEIATFDPAVDLNIVDVTGFIRSQYAALSAFAGFQLRELVWEESTQFISSEGREGARPLLEITYRTAVPEPATLALFGLGLAGLGYSRRRQHTDV